MIFHRHLNQGNQNGETARRLRELVQCVDAILWRGDPETFQFTFVSQRAEEILGYPVERWLTESDFWINLIHPQDRDLTVADRQAAIQAEGNQEFEYRAIAADGNVVWLHEKIYIIRDEQGSPYKTLGLMVDITKRKQMEEELWETHRRLAGLNNTLPFIIFSRTNELDWAMSYISEGCSNLTGYTNKDLLGRSSVSYDSITHPEDLSIVLDTLAAALSSKQPYEVEYRILTKSGQEKWLCEKGSGVFEGHGEVRRFEGFITDITAFKRTQAQLEREAFHDKLTDLPNRALFMDRLDHAVKRTQRQPDSLFAVLFLDLDRFKVINDSLGHRAGDQLLIAVAQKLQAILRPGDTVARLGGDEFTMLLEDIQDESDVTLICDRILREISVPSRLDGREIFATTSIGVVLSTSGYDQPEELLRDADVALYHAKALGKARYAMFNADMHVRAVERQQLATELRSAIEHQELRLYYQPIVALDTDQPVGFEALVYWQHPERGLLEPNEFMVLAEETGLIVAIGQWVLQEACRQIRAWQEQFPQSFPLFMGINLSRQEVYHGELLERIQHLLEETELDPQCLCLEIKESTILEDSDSVATNLLQLKDLGLQLCIDDIGTGYPSLSYLNRFSIDLLKLDRTITRRVDHAEILAIVQPMLQRAKTLGIKLVAEGIEAVTQLAQLRACNCEYGQGYFFARPLDVDAAETLLQQISISEASGELTVALPRLVIDANFGRHCFLLVGQTAWTIGRSQDNTIVLLDRMVSRNHAILLYVQKLRNFYFVDLGSRNGSFINSQLIQRPMLLQEGDQLRIGMTQLEFHLVSMSAETEGTHQPLKTVLISQSSNLQGEIWKEVLSSQGIIVIGQTADTDLAQTLEQFEACGEALPDMLLLDMNILKMPAEEFFQWCSLSHPNLTAILTSGSRTEVSLEERQEIIQQGALDLLAGFPERDLPLYSADIAAKVNSVLRSLDYPPIDQQSLETALNDLQSVMKIDQAGPI